MAASVKFWPEMVTSPPPPDVGAVDPVSLAVVLLSTELPAQPARRTALTAAAAPARSRLLMIGSHLLCPAPHGARVRYPLSCQGMRSPSLRNDRWRANVLPAGGIPRRIDGPFGG